MMDDEQVKRKRKANWSQDQLLLLAQFVLERRGVIKGRFGAGVTSKKKREAWEEISVNINASFPAVCRSTDDCEKRWYALQSQCRFEIADHKRAVAATGGGPAPKPLSPVASVVYAVLGSDISITGLEGAADPAVDLLKEIEGYPFLCQLFLFQLHLLSQLVLFQLHLLSQLFLFQLSLFQLSLLVHPLALLSLLLLVPVHCWRRN
ncbi:unnamed protein product [Arctogadus glacialis]